jgi:hypothetical protein
MKGRWRLLGVLAAVGLVPAGCTEQTSDPEAPVDGGVEAVESAAEALSRVEAELMTAQGTVIRVHVVSEGAFSASLVGEVILAAGDELSMEAAGTFGGDSVELRLRGAGDQMVWSNGERSEAAALPPGLREAVVIGLVRMGVLHNLARLVSGAPPDRTDGTVRSWVGAEEVTWVREAGEEGGRDLAFGIVVAGERAGDATLRLDAGGRLVRRDQVVRFPGGEMRVVEQYHVHH